MTGPWLASTLRAVPIQATADSGGRARVHPGRPAPGPGCHRRRGALQRDHDAGQYLRAAMERRAPSEADLYELVVEDEAPNSDASAGIRAGMTRIDVLLHLRHSDPIPAGDVTVALLRAAIPVPPTRLAVDAAKTMPVPWTSIVAPVLSSLLGRLSSGVFPVAGHGRLAWWPDTAAKLGFCWPVRAGWGCPCPGVLRLYLASKRAWRPDSLHPSLRRGRGCSRSGTGFTRGVDELGPWPRVRARGGH